MKENPLAKYGVTKPVQRPKIKPVKQLDLDTPEEANRSDRSKTNYADT